MAGDRSRRRAAALFRHDADRADAEVPRLALELKRARHARERWGRPRAVAGVLTETLFSVLLSPILMVTQTAAVFQVIFGLDSGWRAQSRDGAGITFTDAVRYHRWHMLIGVMTAVVCYEASPLVLAWMSPVIVGLVLSPPLSWLHVTPGAARAPHAALHARRPHAASHRRERTPRFRRVGGPHRHARPRRRTVVEITRAA
ncbi:MAG: hypothetical protein WDN31_22245 [Hyphomicrobium sp.]